MILLAPLSMITKSGNTPNNGQTLRKPGSAAGNPGGFAFFGDRRGHHTTSRNHSEVMVIDTLVRKFGERVGENSRVFSAYGFMKMYTR
jgi:hypothetical protein